MQGMLLVLPTADMASSGGKPSEGSSGDFSPLPRAAVDDDLDRVPWFVTGRGFLQWPRSDEQDVNLLIVIIIGVNLWLMLITG